MSFPIIQQESPIQQLAQVLRRISERQQERRAQDEELRRRDAYLQLAQQQQAGVEQQRVQSQANADRAFNYGVQQDQYGRTRQMEQDKIAGVDRARAGVRAGLPEDTRISDTLADRAAVDPLEVEQITGFARQQARPATQGSYTAPGRIGSYKGATVDLGTRNINLPSGGSRVGTSGAGHDRTMLGIANTGAMAEAAIALNQLEDDDPSAPERGLLSTGLRGLASRVGGVIGGDDVRDAAGAIGLTENQIQYDRTLEQWVHNYLPNIPGFRMSVPMFNSVRRAYGLPPGSQSQQVKDDIRRRRNLTTDGIVRARAAGLSEQEYGLQVARLWREHGAGEAANELEMFVRSGGVRSAVNSQGRSVGVPGQGYAQESGSMSSELDMEDEEPIVLPRYRRRP